MTDEIRSPLADAIDEARELLEHVRSGGTLEEKYTVRTATFEGDFPAAGPEDMKRVRKQFHASQALMAKFLGVSPSTVLSWEQGTRVIPGMAARYIQDLSAFPELWEDKFKVSQAKLDADRKPATG